MATPGPASAMEEITALVATATAPEGAMVCQECTDSGDEGTGTDTVPKHLRPHRIAALDDPTAGLKLYKCCYDSGPPKPEIMITDKGNSKYAVVTCKSCYNTLKCLERQYSKTPETKELLKQFRKDTVAFHALIRRLRVRMLPEDIGVDTLKDRQN